MEFRKRPLRYESKLARELPGSLPVTQKERGCFSVYTERIERAVELASICHDGQLRKNPMKRIPYIGHAVAVGMMLVHFGYPEDVVVAGLLHDTVEDTDLELDAIRREFGDDVADLVEDCSERDKSLPWAERKRRYIEHMKTASGEAQAISCCDKIHNMRSVVGIARSGADPWQILEHGKEAQIDRHARLLEIFRGSLPVDMVRAYEEALRAMGQV